MATNSSPWAKGPDRGLKSNAKAGLLPEAPGGRQLFSPALMSDATVREKVRSSGYGVDKVEYKRAEAQVHTLEQKEMEKATFKPDMEKYRTGKKLRKQAQSTGYGKDVPASRETPEPPKPSFKPEVAVGREARKLKKSAPSSGYGRDMPKPKEVPAAPKLPFKPNLDLSASMRKMRKNAPSGTYLQERPKTAPAKSTKPSMLRHTLAEDKGAPTHEPHRDVGPGFILTTADRVKTSAEINNGTFPPVEPLPPSAEQLKLKESAKSSGYASGEYEPEMVKVVPKEAEPVLNLGTAGTTYVDSPTKMERFERGAQSSKLLKNVVGSGYSSADYQPRQGELKEVEPGPLWKPSNQTGNVLLPVELLERPVSTDVVVSKEVMSSGYGTKGDWQPPLGQKKRIDYYRPESAGASVSHVSRDAAPDAMETGEDAEVQEDEDEVTAMPLDDGGAQDIDEY